MTGLTALIIDASVLGKLVLAEPEAALVAQRMQAAGRDVPLLAPALLRYEVENLTLQGSQRSETRIAPEELARQTAVAAELVTEVADRPDPFALALKHRLTSYDAAYLALTLDSGPGARLWTYDAQLARAAEAEGVLARDADFPA